MCNLPSILVVVVATTVAAIESPSGANKPARQEAAGSSPVGRVIHEKVDPHAFNPVEQARSTTADVNLRELFELLGPDAIEWYQHVQTLSNPWFEGRCPGTQGHDRAVDYLEWWMTRVGLDPAFAPSSKEASTSERTYRQPFMLSGAEPKVMTAKLSVAGNELVLEKDFIVAAASANGEISAPLAFAGYAIKEGKDGYSSFDNDDDVRNRVAIVFRQSPLNESGGEIWLGQQGAPRVCTADKLRELVERGAVGILVVNPPGAKGIDRPLEDLRSTRWGGRRSVPIMQLTTEQADTLVRSADPNGRDLLTLRQLADNGRLTDFAMRPEVVVSMAAELGESTVSACNVGGILPGRGSLKNEWIVVGGHLDHLGFGQFGTDSANRGLIHPGADDNASGTAGVLVLARKLREAYVASGEGANLRSVLFLCFSGEESGLDGSKYWTQNPTLDARSISAMLNMDMIGRLRNSEVSIGGTGTARGFDAKLQPHIESSGLLVHADPSGRGPSDHASFYRASVPVLFFFTGTHENYHRPTDQAYTVNPRGAAQVIEFVQSILMDLVDDPANLEFLSSEGTPGTDRGYASVRLGIAPSTSDDESGGVLVESVSAGTAAEESGIKPGDVIFLWNGRELGGPGDMMSRLQEHRPGDRVILSIRRDGSDMDITVALKASKPRG